MRERDTKREGEGGGGWFSGWVGLGWDMQLSDQWKLF